MVSVFAGLYGLAFIFGLFFAVSILTESPSLTNIFLFLFILLVFLFRTIYVAMYAAGEFREEGPGSFVLVEPPSFFILYSASLLVMSYGFCVFCLKNSIPQESVYVRFWFLWLAFAVFLFCVMVVIVALLSTLNESDTVIVSCYGRHVTVIENFTVQTIRIAYHSFLLFLAIIAAVTIIYLGRELHNTLQTESLSILSLITCLSVLATSVLWVAYSAASGSTPYFIIPLWFCECPPLLITCFLVRPQKAQSGGDGSTYSRSSRTR